MASAEKVSDRARLPQRFGVISRVRRRADGALQRAGIAFEQLAD